ncbi:MAG TPA: FecR domain-containing protein [Rhodanobacteraceae bacterium]|nr:FecR domain-containing protein [Rhodanobacteraceae bacterium]
MNPESGPIERTAAAWLARHDSGRWSPIEQAALDAWLAEDTAHRVAYLRLQAAWREAGRLKALGAGADSGRVPAPGEWFRSPYFHSPALREQRHAHRARRRTRFSAWPAAIAAGMLVVALACGLWWWQGFDQVQRGAWHTALGDRLVVHLADGSTATLASESALGVALTRRERDLDLVRGEAFFEVAKDPGRPFVVHAGAYQVIAVGTRFDVRRDDRGMRVVVTRGVVRLQSTDDPVLSPTELPAGSIARVTDGHVTVQHVPLGQVVQYLSWRDGYVVFHGTPLADAVREFNRYNARKIVIVDPSLDELKVGGNFRLDNSDAFVRLVQEVFPVRAEGRGDRIVLSRRSGGPRAD